MLEIETLEGISYASAFMKGFRQERADARASMQDSLGLPLLEGTSYAIRSGILGSIFSSSTAPHQMMLFFCFEPMISLNTSRAGWDTLLSFIPLQADSRQTPWHRAGRGSRRMHPARGGPLINGVESRAWHSHAGAGNSRCRPSCLLTSLVPALSVISASLMVRSWSFVHAFLNSSRRTP